MKFIKNKTGLYTMKGGLIRLKKQGTWKISHGPFRDIRCAFLPVRVQVLPIQMQFI
jgi:hypothetical protein